MEQQQFNAAERDALQARRPARRRVKQTPIRTSINPQYVQRNFESGSILIPTEMVKLLFPTNTQNPTIPESDPRRGIFIDQNKLYRCNECDLRFCYDTVFSSHLHRKCVKISVYRQDNLQPEIFYNRCSLLANLRRTLKNNSVRVNIEALRPGEVELPFFPRDKEPMGVTFKFPRSAVNNSSSSTSTSSTSQRSPFRPPNATLVNGSVVIPDNARTQTNQNLPSLLLRNMAAAKKGLPNGPAAPLNQPSTSTATPAFTETNATVYDFTLTSTATNAITSDFTPALNGTNAAPDFTPILTATNATTSGFTTALNATILNSSPVPPSELSNFESSTSAETSSVPKSPLRNRVFVSYIRSDDDDLDVDIVAPPQNTPPPAPLSSSPNPLLTTAVLSTTFGNKNYVPIAPKTANTVNRPVFIPSRSRKKNKVTLQHPIIPINLPEITAKLVKAPSTTKKTNEENNKSMKLIKFSSLNKSSTEAQQSPIITESSLVCSKDAYVHGPCGICELYLPVPMEKHFNGPDNTLGPTVQICDVCKLPFRFGCPLKAHKLLHRQDYYLEDKFTCPECGLIYSEWDKFLVHINKICFHTYAVAAYVCKLCGKIFRQSDALKTHISNVHLKRFFKCGKCHIGFCNEDKYNEHTNERKKEGHFDCRCVRVHLCEMCPQKVIPYSQIGYHCGQHVESKSSAYKGYLCHKCNVFSSKKEALIAHKKTCPGITAKYRYLAEIASVQANAEEIKTKGEKENNVNVNDNNNIDAANFEEPIVNALNRRNDDDSEAADEIGKNIQNGNILNENDSDRSGSALSICSNEPSVNGDDCYQTVCVIDKNGVYIESINTEESVNELKENADDSETNDIEENVDVETIGVEITEDNHNEANHDESDNDNDTEVSDVEMTENVETEANDDEGENNDSEVIGSDKEYGNNDESDDESNINTKPDTNEITIEVRHRDDSGDDDNEMVIGECFTIDENQYSDEDEIQSTTNEVDEEHEPESNEIEEEHEPETSEVDEEHEPETSEVDEEHEPVTNEIDEEHEPETTDVEEDHEPVTNEVYEEHEPETTDVEEDHELVTNEVDEEHEPETTDVEEDHEPVTNEVEEEHEPETTDVEEDHEPVTNKVDEEHEPETTDVEEEYEPETTDVEEEYEPETTDVEEEYEPETTDVEEEYEPETTDVEEEHEPETTDVEEEPETTEIEEKEKEDESEVNNTETELHDEEFEKALLANESESNNDEIENDNESCISDGEDELASEIAFTDVNDSDEDDDEETFDYSKKKKVNERKSNKRKQTQQPRNDYDEVSVDGTRASKLPNKRTRKPKKPYSDEEFSNKRGTRTRGKREVVKNNDNIETRQPSSRKKVGRPKVSQQVNTEKPSTSNRKRVGRPPSTRPPSTRPPSTRPTSTRPPHNDDKPKPPVVLKIDKKRIRESIDDEYKSMRKRRRNSTVNYCETENDDESEEEEKEVEVPHKTSKNDSDESGNNRRSSRPRRQSKAKKNADFEYDIDDIIASPSKKKKTYNKICHNCGSRLEPYKRRLACYTCNKKLSKNHLIAKTSKTTLKAVPCPRCELQLKDEFNSIRAHMDRFHRDLVVTSKNYRKELCEEAARLIKIQNKDVEESDDETEYTYKCRVTLCRFGTDDRYEFKKHILSHRNGNVVFQCFNCGICYSTKSSLQKHLIIEHPEVNTQVDEYLIETGQVAKENPPPPVKENQCGVCYEEFTNNQEKQTHLRSHGMAFLLHKTKK